MSWAVAQENTMDDEDLMTEEDRNREYLRQRPALEMSMWMDWVQTVCHHRKIAPPTAREWDNLTAAFHHGKMPITSVDELEAMRKQPNTEAQRAAAGGPTGAQSCAH